MQTIDQKIKTLQGEIRLWTDILYPHIDQLRQLDGENFKTFILGNGNRKENVSAEFAFESMVAAIGRLRDVVLAGQNFWPDKKESFETELPLSQSYPDQLLDVLREKFRVETKDGFPLTEQLILKRAEGIDEIFLIDHAHDLGAKEIFTVIARWRRALAKATVLESAYINVTERISGERHWTNRIFNRIKEMPFSEKSVFQSALRRYLSSEYIFPWLSDKYSSYAINYKSLFRLAELEDNVMHHHVAVLIDDLFKEGAIQEDAIQQISQILDRMIAALNQLGIYDDLMDQVVYGGGQYGDNSIVGSRDPVNIIPSEGESGECREVLLAFARGRRSPKSGLKAVMRQVREHMIRCHKTRIVMVFTDVWDPEVFAESAADIQAHRESMPPKTIIGVLMNGNRLTPQAINS